MPGPSPACGAPSSWAGLAPPAPTPCVFALLQSTGSECPASPAVKGWASKLCLHPPMPWEFGMGTEVIQTFSFWRSHPPPAIPTSVNTFQGSHSFGTAQETPTRCAQVASRVADVLLQFWLWKFPWEYLQHPCRMVGAWMQGFLPCLYDAGKRPLLLHIPTSL